MNETFLQFIWKYRLFNQIDIKSTSGENISIISTGDLNFDAGPDFFNAKIKIDDTILAGNIEIHTKSSDWNLHKHSEQSNYSNIILHVVFDNDSKENLGNFSTLELKNLISPNTIKKYNDLYFSKQQIPCENNLKNNISNFFLIHWLTRIGVERIERKTHDIQLILNQTNNDWEQAFFIVLAKNLGFKLNAVAFEMLAKSAHHSVLEKYKKHLFQIEAILFGISGLIQNPVDEYSAQLKKEFTHLKQKHNFIEMDASNWKFLRTRPANFPTIRIAQLASLIENSNKLFSKIIEKPNLSVISELFNTSVSDYWTTHYLFGKESKYSKRAITTDVINNFCINTIAPFLILWGEMNGDENFKNHAINLLEEIPSEKNSIINKFEELNIKSNNALEGQALIELKNMYCSNKKCLDCQIGMRIVNSD
ncbi:MAG: DUF2851 family protein [Bacteroidota bacterium]